MEEKTMKKRQSDTKTTKQVRIDAGIHKIVKVKAAGSGRTIRELVEECLIELISEVNEK